MNNIPTTHTKEHKRVTTDEIIIEITDTTSNSAVKGNQNTYTNTES